MGDRNHRVGPLFQFQCSSETNQTTVEKYSNSRVDPTHRVLACRYPARHRSPKLRFAHFGPKKMTLCQQFAFTHDATKLPAVHWIQLLTVEAMHESCQIGNIPLSHEATSENVLYTAVFDTFHLRFSIAPTKCDSASAV